MTKPRRAVHALVLAVCATACGGARGSGDHPESTGSYASIPPSPPSFVAAAANLGMTASAFLDSLPCPPPGLPPELSHAIDCAAMRRVSSAVRYVPMSVAAGSLPREVDLRVAHLMGPVKDQGAVGSCMAFALSTVIDSSARRMGRGDVASPLHIFSIYGREMNASLVQGKPLTLEPVWPYDSARACAFTNGEDGCGSTLGMPEGNARSDPGLMAEKARADASGRYRVDAFEEVTPVDPTQLAILIAGGEPVFASLAIDDRVWNGFGGDVLPDYSAPYPDMHAIVLAGYRQGPREREFLVQNSWGRSWGNGGTAWMSESTFVRNAGVVYRLRVNDAAMPVPPQNPGAAIPTIAWPTLPTCSSGGLQTPFGCMGAIGSSPFPIPTLPGWPTTLPPLANCSSGSLPNPLTGVCVRL